MSANGQVLTINSSIGGGGGGGSSVTSVFTRTGAVVADTGDYNASQVTNAAATNAANTFSTGPQILVGGFVADVGSQVGKLQTFSPNFDDAFLQTFSAYGASYAQYAITGQNFLPNIGSGSGAAFQYSDAAAQDLVIAAYHGKTLRLGVDNGSSTGASTVQITQSGTNFTGSISSGGTAAISTSVALAKLTTGGANGSMSFVNGLLTAYTAPS